jgi:hypothetical protein
METLKILARFVLTSLLIHIVALRVLRSLSLPELKYLQRVVIIIVSNRRSGEWRAFWSLCQNTLFVLFHFARFAPIVPVTF